jgi:hypothetical protein
MLRGNFTDEEERDKKRQEAPFDHIRIRVCSSEHYVFLQEATEGTEILFRKMKREKRQKHFSFSIKEISTPLALVYSSIVKT